MGEWDGFLKKRKAGKRKSNRDVAMLKAAIEDDDEHENEVGLEQKGAEEDGKGQHFWSFFSGEASLPSAACIAAGSYRNYTKTRKCTTFPQLFFVSAGTGEG